MKKENKKGDLISLPDKYIDKSTITRSLREFIRGLAAGYGKPVYLEVGCYKGYTLFSVFDRFEKCIGLDIDLNCISYAEHLKRTFQSKFKIQMANISFLHCPSELIPPAEYHVVLIDAAHDYESVKRDFHNVAKVNRAERYHLVFHDYGLDGAGVKQFVNEQFPGQYAFCGDRKGWNPRGTVPAIDWEAAYVEIGRLRS
jgi:hypothetical protein